MINFTLYKELKQKLLPSKKRTYKKTWHKMLFDVSNNVNYSKLSFWWAFLTVAHCGGCRLWHMLTAPKNEDLNVNWSFDKWSVKLSKQFYRVRATKIPYYFRFKVLHVVCLSAYVRKQRLGAFLSNETYCCLDIASNCVIYNTDTACISSTYCVYASRFKFSFAV